MAALGTSPQLPPSGIASWTSIRASFNKTKGAPSASPPAPCAGGREPAVKVAPKPVTLRVDELDSSPDASESNNSPRLNDVFKSSLDLSESATSARSSPASSPTLQTSTPQTLDADVIERREDEAADEGQFVREPPSENGTTAVTSEIEPSEVQPETVGPLPRVILSSDPATTNSVKPAAVASPSTEAKKVEEAARGFKTKSFARATKAILKKVAHAAYLSFRIDPTVMEPVPFPVCQYNAMADLSTLDRDQYLG